MIRSLDLYLSTIAAIIFVLLLIAKLPLKDIITFMMFVIFLLYLTYKSIK